VRAGVLLSLVRATTAGAARLAGVDLCLPELRAARERLGGGVTLSCARGQALPFPGRSFDLALCHMALMLVDRPEEVLAESRRVLRAGGVFSAVTNRPAAPPDVIARTILGALRGRWQAADPALRPPALGDERTYDAEGLRALVGAHFGHVVLEPFAVTQFVLRRELWRYLSNSVYGLDAIPADEGQAILDGLTLPELVPWTVALVQVSGRA
jgi:ubiquinone/menaquinone biosynthesis C-methylase UbiE